jgi:hypothetical protein
MEITRSIFESQRQRRFGTANPERMRLAFWEWMVRGSEDARTRDWNAERDPSVLGHTPTAARGYFGQEGDDSQGPIWNFDRMGATRTPHPDGRMICIGGEHEDHYDPDFCIYNDLVVLDLDGSIEIYGYPRDVFSPTDFHTATLVGDRVIVIGRLGYPEERHPGATPVMALDLATYRIEKLPSHGELPGWVFGHAAEFSHGVITIRGGEVFEEKDGEPRIRRNSNDFAYEVGTGLWKRLTNRNWWQYEIKDEGGKAFMRGPRFRGCCSLDDEQWKGEPEEEESNVDGPLLYVMPEALLPRNFRYETVWSDEPSLEDRILVAGIPVSIKMGPFSIEIVVEGEMDEAMADELAQDIREGVEADTGRRCFLKKYD